jgi:ribonuclease D
MYQQGRIRHRLANPRRVYYDAAFWGRANSQPPDADALNLVQYEHITTDQQLRDYCDSLSGIESIGFDTEFVSEDTYRPQLCLIQVAAADRLAVIDPLSMDDVTPFWKLLTDGEHETIVHAGREEFRFCLDATGQRPSGWFDIQIAAGFLGLEYPAAYSTLIYKLLDESLPKGETRTDWRKRPLSKKQLEYALQDVMYLKPLRDMLVKRIEARGRLAWLADEFVDWQDQLELTENTEQWRRVSGSAGLSRRQLAIVRELWRWRDAEAKEKDRPPKRILRDDLIVELARRQTDQISRIRAVRGMEHRHVQRVLPELAECAKRGLELPEAECPARTRRKDSTQPPFVLLGQFLNAALGCICRSTELAPGLVGSVQDARDLVAYRLGLSGTTPDEIPSLARGWRAEVVGKQIDQLLAGETVLRIVDPKADSPLDLAPYGNSSPS